MRAAWRRRPALRIALLAGLAVAVAAWQAAEPWLFPGPVIVSGRVLDGQSVIDGDTLKVAGQSIRLHGIDAPELRQDCNGWPAGEEARRALAALVTARPVECRRVMSERRWSDRAWHGPIRPIHCATCCRSGRRGSMDSAFTPAIA